MKIKRIIYNDISNGPGFRTSIFIAGCDGVIWNKKTKKYDHCPGCFNSEAWADAGEELTQELLDKIILSIEPDYIDGVSILGGEPMSKRNQYITWRIVNEIRRIYKDKKSIWLWTGYQYSRNPFNKNRIPKTFLTKSILRSINALVDGPFVANKFDIDLKYKGSSNQRVIHLR